MKFNKLSLLVLIITIGIGAIAHADCISNIVDAAVLEADSQLQGQGLQCSPRTETIKDNSDNSYDVTLSCRKSEDSNLEGINKTFRVQLAENERCRVISTIIIEIDLGLTTTFQRAL